MRPKWVTHEELAELPATSLYLSTVAVPEKDQIPVGSFLIKAVPKGVSWGSVSKGYTYNHSSSLIVPTAQSQATEPGNDWRVNVIFT